MPENPIPPEALTGCECLVWTTEARHPKVAKFDGTHWLVLHHNGKFVFEFPNVTRAIPMSVVEASPGMRVVLKALLAIMDTCITDGRFAGVGRSIMKDAAELCDNALAACDGKNSK